jgi:hypothetical protein
MVSFAALSGLISPERSAFYSVPEAGSSFVFELCSLQAENSEGFPNISDMYVRFFYKNGTGSGSSLIEYPLFDFSPSQSMVPLTDFAANLQRFEISNVESWCTICNSFSIFCPAFTGSSGTLNPVSPRPLNKKGFSPVIAGVIGAVVTLAICLLLFGVLMLLAGLRVHRVHTKRKSSLEGFKGSQRLASDQDLTIPKGSAGAVVISSPDPVQVRGHERVGSWELNDQTKVEEARNRSFNGAALGPRRPSYEDDVLPINAYASPVEPRDHV